VTRVFVRARPEDVFDTLAGTATRPRWLRLPGKEVARHHDIRVAGEERVSSTMRIGDHEERLEHRSTFLAIDPPRRLQTAYVAIVDDLPRWSSLVDVRIADDADGAALTWSESFLFSVLSGDGADDVAHLRGGVRLRLNALQALLDDVVAS